MKKITFLLTLVTISLTYGQHTVPLVNADVESATAMSTTDDRTYSTDGMSIVEAVDGSFDEANSGLASDKGVGGSQAFKIKTESGAVGWHTQFVVDRVDVSGYGFASFDFSFQLKAETLPDGFPIWMVIVTYDEDGNNVTSETLDSNYKNGGAIASLSDIATSFQETSIPFTLQSNSTGKDAKYIELRVQMAKYANTYYIDNLSLSSSAALSVKSFETIGVNMYPNPAASFTTIKSATALQNITLTSLLGKTLFTQKLNITEFNLDVSSFAKGVYILDVTNEKGKSSTKLIVD